MAENAVKTKCRYKNCTCLEFKSTVGAIGICRFCGHSVEFTDIPAKELPV